LLDPRPVAVTCPLCGVLLAGRHVALSALAVGQRALTDRLEQAQARPEAQALGEFMRLVVRARRATRPTRT
jgi:hypothetical protein